jgi:hypothetical protein
MATAVTILVLAFLLVSLYPFLADAPSAGSWLDGAASTVPVDRALKGDPLAPAKSPDYVPDFNFEFDALPHSDPITRPRAQMPVGCDPVFSQIFASPQRPNIYRRCTV